MVSQGNDPSTRPASASSKLGGPIALVSSHLPRPCGLASFTHSLCQALNKVAKTFAIAVSDRPEGYNYPPEVRFEVRETVLDDYRQAGNFVNVHQCGVLCLQHEYGIFGGPAGGHVLAMLRANRRPCVTALHTILKDPSDDERRVLKAICDQSDKVVSLSQIGAQILRETYDVPADSIAVVPHGIPDAPFVDPNYYKDMFGVEGKKVLLTTGLLSPQKGIEGVLDALPAILAEHPQAVYMVVGRTHPKVVRQSGEEYRNSLQRRVQELGLADRVIFHNRFISEQELTEYIGAADVYLAPYLNAEQVVSGPLTFAMGLGKPVISTPFWYAQEMLADDRGVIVPFADPPAIAQGVCDLLDNEARRHALRRDAYAHCRPMTWARVASDYLEVFADARQRWTEKRRKVTLQPSRPRTGKPDAQLPEVDLNHLETLTDDTGIFQHCRFLSPDRRHGYCTDDNARALIVACMHWDQFRHPHTVELIQRYLAFLTHAMDATTGRFRNFFGYNRKWLESAGSPDSHARALWGLGVATRLCPHESLIAIAARLMQHGLPAVDNFNSPRSWAFAICGLSAYLERFGGDSDARRRREDLASRLVEAFTQHMSDDWPWLEDTVTYSNAKLPHALLLAGAGSADAEFLRLGLRVLDWLCEVQTNEQGMLSIVGNEGWMPRTGTRARFAQQPVDAHAMVDACAEAYRLTGQKKWLDRAFWALGWFLGDNDLRTPLVDFTTGGCRDGLHADSVNENQGAESTLSWLMSLLTARELQFGHAIDPNYTPDGASTRPVPRPVKSTGKIR